MRWVRRLVLAALLGGAVAWLVAGRKPKRPSLSVVPPPAAATQRPGDHAEASTAGLIKGNASSMIYHVPGSPSYERTVAQAWFRTEQEAVAAGFRPPKRRGSPRS